MLLIGTYTRNTESRGVYLFAQDSHANLVQQACFSEIDNPSFIVKHPQLNTYYVVNEVTDFNGSNNGGISCYRLLGSDQFELVNQLDSMGGDPCHLCVDPNGKFILVSNYQAGCFSIYPLAEDGSLKPFHSLVEHHGSSVDPVRQKSSHVHSAVLGPTGSDVYIADLGTDKLIHYPLDADGTVDTTHARASIIKPGAGPRLMAFDSRGQYAFLINELDNTIVSFERDATAGEMTELFTISTLPADYDDASYCAHIAVSSDDGYVYASNRGHDSVAVFKNDGSGRLDLIQVISSGGLHPRHFSLSPDNTQLVVANRDSDNLAVFECCKSTGKLTQTGEVSVPAPVCVLFI